MICNDCYAELFDGGCVCCKCGAALCWVCGLDTLDGNMCQDCYSSSDSDEDAELEEMFDE
jgi:hypothetical protein